MNVDFVLPSDGKMHRFCISCKADGLEQIIKDGRTVYHCDTCGKTNTRGIYFNKHKFWADRNGQLWHESVGVFVRNQEGKYLFFQRTEFPFSLTIPAGHVDLGESPESAAARELEEEVNLKAKTLHHLGTSDIWGDSCSAGADVHKWNTYLVELYGSQDVKVLEEGKNPVWLSIDEAKKSDLTFAVSHLVHSIEDL